MSDDTVSLLGFVFHGAVVSKILLSYKVYENLYAGQLLIPGTGSCTLWRTVKLIPYTLSHSAAHSKAIE
jgi:hypothetical protein